MWIVANDYVHLRQRRNELKRTPQVVLGQGHLRRRRGENAAGGAEEGTLAVREGVTELKLPGLFPVFELGEMAVEEVAAFGTIVRRTENPGR